MKMGFHRAPSRHPHGAAFSLLEVMIALAIFFMAIFTILGSVSQSLAAARRLQQKFPDMGMLTADLMLTNRLEEGTGQGDFGDAYPGYRWAGATNQIATNGLFQIDFTIYRIEGRNSTEYTTSILVWRPDSEITGFGRRR